MKPITEDTVKVLIYRLEARRKQNDARRSLNRGGETTARILDFPQEFVSGSRPHEAAEPLDLSRVRRERNADRTVTGIFLYFPRLGS